MQKLKPLSVLPCPFCGNHPDHIDEIHGPACTDAGEPSWMSFFVRCDCEAAGPTTLTTHPNQEFFDILRAKVSALEAWNRRSAK